jgi:hypothetical protein
MSSLYREGLNTRRAQGGTPEALCPSAIPSEGMEHLWSVMKKGLLAGDTLR